MWCWGANKKGQLGFGKTSRNSVTPLQVSIPDCSQKFVHVVAGSHHSAALTASGQVFCWGSNQHGQCGRPPEHCAQIFANPQLIRGAISDKHIAQLKSGWSHLLALTGLIISTLYIYLFKLMITFYNTTKKIICSRHSLTNNGLELN